MRRFAFIGFFVSIWLMGCPRISPVELPIPAHESKLVMNAFLNNEEIIQVFLSRSQSVLQELDTAGNYVAGANLSLWEDDVFIENLQPRDSNYWAYFRSDSFWVKRISYESSIIPEPGKTYRIEAQHPDFEPIRAETTLPTPPQIANPEIEFDMIRDQNGVMYSSFFFHILSDKTSYAGLDGELIYEDTIFNSYLRRYGFRFDSPLNFPKLSTGPRIYWINEVNETAQVFFRVNQWNEGLPRRPEKIKLNYTFSDSMYHAYQVAFERHNQAAFFEPDFLFPIEKSESPSNVEGGYGILGSFIRVRDSL